MCSPRDIVLSRVSDTRVYKSSPSTLFQTNEDKGTPPVGESLLLRPSTSNLLCFLRYFLSRSSYLPINLSHTRHTNAPSRLVKIPVWVSFLISTFETYGYTKTKRKILWRSFRPSRPRSHQESNIILKILPQIT